MAAECAKAASYFKALGDVHRIQILRALRSGEKCGCDILDELDISQPTLSHHMKILCDAGLVTGRKEGKWMYCSVCCEGAAQVRKILQLLTDPDNIPVNCPCVEEAEPSI